MELLSNWTSLQYRAYMSLYEVLFLDSFARTEDLVPYIYHSVGTQDSAIHIGSRNMPLVAVN